MYVCMQTHVHSYILRDIYLLTQNVYRHAWNIYTSMHSYIHTCLPGKIHDSAFLDFIFLYFHFRNFDVTEIWKSKILKSWMFEGRHVNMYVYTAKVTIHYTI